jgi:predicted 3-demethylubiquinone-9 3-methyltransferase (glyoxalase superfamily)
MAGVTPFIWFNNNAEEAMDYYVSLFGGKVLGIERYAGNQGIPGEEVLKGKVLTGSFEIMGQTFMCLDGGVQPGFEMTSAISFLVEIDDQKDLDIIWDKLMADGAKPQQCGWITDKFGVTWQITPTSFGKMMSDPDATPEQKAAVMQAMMPMVKLDGPKLEAAFNSAKA